jgi:hypothetical protein
MGHLLYLSSRTALKHSAVIPEFGDPGHGNHKKFRKKFGVVDTKELSLQDLLNQRFTRGV